MIGERIREIRKAKGLTQRQVAAKSGLSNASIAFYELGNADPTLGSIIKVAKALECSIIELLDITDQECLMQVLKGFALVEGYPGREQYKLETFLCIQTVQLGLGNNQTVDFTFKADGSIVCYGIYD